jgi:Fe-S-cluster containining protein
MESDGNVAQISLESQTRSIKHVTFYVKDLRFRCKRCATFCCKLGGPPLSLKDVKCLKKAGHSETEFLDASHGRLKNTAHGSCVYLRFDTEKHIYECAVYDYRPALCRLYPFHFEKTSPNSFVLKTIPCKGINRCYGELVDERFILGNLLDALHDLYF